MRTEGYRSRRVSVRETDHPLAQDLFLHPTRWRLWPAVAVLRWLQGKMRSHHVKIAYRGRATLSFSPCEIADINLQRPARIEIVVNALGIASPGTGLPGADVSRIIADDRSTGALARWLDMIADRMLHAAEASMSRSNRAFACARGDDSEARRTLTALVGHDAVLAEHPEHGLVPMGTPGARRLDALAAIFVGQPSAHGLARIFEAYTGLHTRVTEHTPDTIDVARPARLGAPMRRILGAKRRIDEAGVTLRMNDAERCEEATRWTSDRTSIQSLYRLAAAYIADARPRARIEVAVPAHTVRPARLGTENARLGANAMLNIPNAPRVVLRLEHP